MWVAGQGAASDSLSLVTSVPATATDPASGRSMPAISFSRVVLPAPEGPSGRGTPLRARRARYRAARESPCCRVDRTWKHRGPARSDWAWTPLLHRDFGASMQAGADAVDHLNARTQSFADGHGRPYLPAPHHPHLHRPAALHDENDTAAVSLGHRGARAYQDRLRVHGDARRARQEVYLGTHLRQYPGVIGAEGNFDLHGRLGAIRGRHDLGHDPRV